MKKYQKFLTDSFGFWKKFVAILSALLMLFFIAIEMDAPIDATELGQHYSQLEMVKQDVANIYKLTNATITIKEQTTTIILDGSTHDLKAVFDTNGNCIEAKVIDNRVGANFDISIFAILFAVAAGYILMTGVEVLLYIPLIIYAAIQKIKSKRIARKNKPKT